MERLNNKLIINGMQYELIRRTSLVALYSIQGGRYFEVSRIYIMPEQQIYDHSYPEREVLPTNDQFGKDGSRFYRSESKAQIYYNHFNRDLGRKRRSNVV